ncbi:hypothetical protein GLYMA_19G118200v4 [Glycine max]|uniref:Uncharacterized protein n=1 Tax=Glycine max TaxID=3847 RepID=K7MXY6_SOYBN|nr:hypothetical protein JHK85_054148 [Glycine max]KRG94923.1 hypothetical protein GLYMA_19G118200v4 [Glycine max]
MLNAPARCTEKPLCPETGKSSSDPTKDMFRNSAKAQPANRVLPFYATLKKKKKVKTIITRNCTNIEISSPFKFTNFSKVKACHTFFKP